MDIVDIILQAELGNLEAQYVLGNCYMVGKGVEKDPNDNFFLRIERFQIVETH